MKFLKFAFTLQRYFRELPDVVIYYILLNLIGLGLIYFVATMFEKGTYNIFWTVVVGVVFFGVQSIVSTDFFPKGYEKGLPLRQVVKYAWGHVLGLCLLGWYGLCCVEPGFRVVWQST